MPRSVLELFVDSQLFRFEEIVFGVEILLSVGFLDAKSLGKHLMVKAHERTKMGDIDCPKALVPDPELIDQPLQSLLQLLSIFILAKISSQARKPRERELGEKPAKEADDGLPESHLEAGETTVVLGQLSQVLDARVDEERVDGRDRGGICGRLGATKLEAKLVHLTLTCGLEVAQAREVGENEYMI